MKTKLFIATFILAFLFNSCSSSDDSASLVGVWKYNRQGVVVEGEEILTPYLGNEAGCDKDTSEFKNNGVLLDSYHTSTCEVVDHPGTYTRSGNTIVATFPESGSFTFTILKLTNTILKVRNSDGNILEFIK